MPTQPKFHHVGGLELVDLEHTPEVGVQVLVQSLALCYNQHQNDVWQTHHGIQPAIPQVAVFGQHLGHKCPMKIFSKNPAYRLHCF